MYFGFHIIYIYTVSVFPLNAKNVKSAKYFPAFSHKFLHVQEGFSVFYCKNNYFKIEKNLKPHLTLSCFSDLTI